MAEITERVPSFEDIVFEFRNKEYGAYVLRKRYKKNVTIALTIGIILILVATITPYIMASVAAGIKKKEAREVEMKMEKLDKPEDEPPPPPPPPPPAEQTVQQVKFTAPVVVDSVIETKQIATFDEVKEIVKDEVPVIQTEVVKEEVVEEAPKETFIIVEEMPEFPGGNDALTKFLAENIKYPSIARENDIKGKVYVRFRVTYKGAVDEVQIARGVDPILDEEAVRVVKAMPPWKPGKQRGKAVNVWYTVPINFQLQ